MEDEVFVNNKYVKFNVYESIKLPRDMHVVSVIDIVNKGDLVASIEERLDIKALVIIIINLKGNGIDDYDDIVRSLEGRSSYTYVENTTHELYGSGVIP